MMFSYNFRYHSTIITSPFELLFGIKAHTPSFPAQDVQKLHYAERLQILQHTRQIVQQHTADKGELYPMKKIGDLVLFSKHNFLGKK